MLLAIRNDCQGRLPFVAEDLGIITSEVEQLRDQFCLPGMKVLQFAFNGDDDNPYLPENIHGERWVVYTGTHDNPTTMGWWNSINEDVKDRVSKRAKSQNISPCWQLIEIGFATEATLFVAPLQDLLCLNNIARFNTPGTVDNNWNWRLQEFDEMTLNALKFYGERAKFWDRN